MSPVPVVRLVSLVLFGYLTVRSADAEGRYTCHCAEGCAGNTVEGHRCGSCAEGFYGSYCQKQNVALRKTTNHSPECFNYEGAGSLAVDGNTTTEFGKVKPHACTCARGTLSTYWSVDLGQSYPIYNIKIYQRNSNHERSNGLTVYVGNQLCHQWSTNTAPGTIFSFTCAQTLRGQWMKVEVPRQVYFVLCEVQIFVCTDLWYGDDCDKTCNCRDQTEVCDKRTGNCTSGCPDGWTGAACDQACADGFWGQMCKNRCGNCDEGSCNKGNGNCASCQSGWAPPQCTFCVDGYWGQSCSTPCNTHCGSTTCDKDTGSCQYCKTGFWGPSCGRECGQCNPKSCIKSDGYCQTCTGKYWGPRCETKCPNNCGGNSCRKENGDCISCTDKYWGPRCKKGCPTNCAGNTCYKEDGESCIGSHWGQGCTNPCGHCNTSFCEKRDGKCECQTGWAAPNCTVCDHGYYGENCSETCGHCVNGSTTCHIATGHCPDGCSAGWKGETCKTECPDGTYGFHCNNTCGHCLNGNASCKKVTGQCSDGCSAGWKGDTCDTECSNGTYGENCGQKCETCKDSNCSRVSGTCIDGCIAGYSRPDTGCSEKLVANNNSIGVAAGGAGAALAVILIVVVVAVVVVRKRRHRQKDRVEKDFTDLKSTEPTPKGEEKEEDNESTDDLEAGVDSKLNTVDDNVYANLANTEIDVNNLHAFIKSKTEDEFKEEYELLPAGLQANHSTGKKPCNKVKNRFVAIFPYDHSRVLLKKSSEEGASDYINANYIDGYSKAKAYIATQGPVPATTGDFWRMIWEQDVGKIVMLANVFEAGKKKCEKYWPEMNEVKTAGELKIKGGNVHERADYTVRELTIQPEKGGVLRTVRMFHFTTWPDHGVPSAPALLSFWKQVKKSTSQTTGPITVHCSAGIGRTGTFIGLDYLVEEARATKTVDVFQCVRKMRDNRINMVQTPDQYHFLHHVILEALSCYETLYTVTSFKERFTESKTLDKKEIVRLQQEFKDIARLKKPVPQSDIDIARLPENKDKNRNPNIVPSSSYRPYLSSQVKGTNDYINAVSLPSCNNKNGFLVTQMPLDSTVVDFWRMIYEKDCLTIVSLTSPDALAASQDIGVYWPEYGDSMTVGPYTVHNKTTVNETSSSTLTELNLVLSKEDQLVYENQEMRNITMFILNNWLMDDRLPRNKYELLMFIDTLERRRQEIGDQPVVIQCIDGAKHSGLFCVLSNIISKLKLDNDVDVFVTVRELQCIRPQFVASFKQYQYCYEVVKEYMSSLEIYGNL